LHIEERPPTGIIGDEGHIRGMGVSVWGMLEMYNDLVTVSVLYTTVQRLYRQNRQDGDGYLIPPQDPWVK
jgi:hypothetical protein